jgi:hypothetical protein
MADPFAVEAFGEMDRRRLAKSRGLKMHATVWAAVNAFLFLLWLITTPMGFPWFLIPAAAWGIGLVTHGAAVKFSDDPETQMLERERRRMLEGGSLPELEP